MPVLVCISFMTPDQHNHPMEHEGSRSFRAAAWYSSCSISKGVRNPNLCPHAAVDNGLVPQIPSLTSGRTPPGVVLKQFPFHARVIELEDSTPSEAPYKHLFTYFH